MNKSMKKTLKQLLTKEKAHENEEKKKVLS
jgi:hypothetical protein